LFDKINQFYENKSIQVEDIIDEMKKLGIFYIENDEIKLNGTINKDAQADIH
jgi:hypothetical protein